MRRGTTAKRSQSGRLYPLVALRPPGASKPCDFLRLPDVHDERSHTTRFGRTTPNGRTGDHSRTIPPWTGPRKPSASKPSRPSTPRCWPPSSTPPRPAPRPHRRHPPRRPQRLLLPQPLRLAPRPGPPARPQPPLARPHLPTVRLPFGRRGLQQQLRRDVLVLHRALTNRPLPALRPEPLASSLASAGSSAWSASNSTPKRRATGSTTRST
jgi:hypothetical protein